MRSTIIQMRVFNDNVHEQFKVFYMEENRWKSEPGVIGIEKERERVKSVRDRVLRQKESVLGINSSAGRISEWLIHLGKTYQE